VRILAIAGSLQAKSGNTVLLEVAAKQATGAEVVTFDALAELPPFNPDLEPPPSVERWRRALAESDAVLVATPEYGFGLRGVLGNAIDWVIGSGELERKVVGITAAVRDAERGRRGLRALADTLRAVSARIVGGQPIVRGPSFEADVAALVRAWVDAFNRADADALASFYAPNAVNHQVAESPREGRDAIRAMFAEGFASAKMVCVVENIFEDGEWAILEWRDPKGLRGCGFFHVKKGEIVFQRGYWDELSSLRQQGLPLPTT
jgi:NAD(P)H-dependent FMN reductase